MLNRNLIYILFFVSCISLFCDNFQNGNFEYNNKNYINAEKEYLKELKDKGNDVNTLFNLGNTYLKLEKSGSALYTFYKALLINPRDNNIKTLVNDLEKQLNIEKTQLKNFGISYNEALLISLISSLLLFIYLVIINILKILKKEKNILFKIKKYITTLLIILAVIFTTITIFYPYKNYGIILNTSNIYLSPYEGSKTTFKAEEGLMVKISEDHNNFIFITDTGNRYGWINKKDLGILWK